MSVGRVFSIQCLYYAQPDRGAVIAMVERVPVKGDFISVNLGDGERHFEVHSVTLQTVGMTPTLVLLRP